MKNRSTPPIHPADAALGRSLLRASVALNGGAALLAFVPALLPAAVNPHLVLPVMLTVGFGLMFSAGRIRSGRWAPVSSRAGRV